MGRPMGTFPQGLARLLVAGICLVNLPIGHAAQALSPLQQAEQWEEVAKLRLQAATGHELQATRRRDEAFRLTDNLATAGDALESAGDEKYLAWEEYQRASKNWANAAKAFKATREQDKARDALENAELARDAARRMLREGAELYRLAEERFESINDLDKKIRVLGKSARNTELLMEMK